MSTTTDAKEPAKAAGAAPVSVTISLAVLREIQEHIRFTDRTAGVLVALNVFLFGLLAKELDSQAELHRHAGYGAWYWVIVGLGGLTILTSVLAVGLICLSFLVRYKGGAASKVHFARIDQVYAADPERYVTDVQAMSETDWTREVGTQVVEASRVAARKEQLLVRSAAATFATYFLWGLAILLFLLLPSSPR
jgi:Pycsar effector protein